MSIERSALPGIRLRYCSQDYATEKVSITSSHKATAITVLDLLYNPGSPVGFSDKVVPDFLAAPALSCPSSP